MMAEFTITAATADDQDGFADAPTPLTGLGRTAEGARPQAGPLTATERAAFFAALRRKADARIAASRTTPAPAAASGIGAGA